MKNTFSIFILLLLFTYNGKAQWFYNPYYPSYTHQSLQEAYDQGCKKGQEIAKKIKGEMKEKEGEKALIIQDYEKALKCFIEAADFGNSEAIYGIALMFECGWGLERNTNKAWEFYQKSAKSGSKTAQTRLQDIQKYGFYTEEQIHSLKEKFENIQKQCQADINRLRMTSPPVNTISLDDNTTTNPSATSVRCKSCNGTGHCTLCKGKTWYKREGDYYDCPVCHSTGNCGVCYGKGTINY